MEQQPHICHNCTEPKCVTHFLVHTVKQKAYGDIMERNTSTRGPISTACFLFINIGNRFELFVYFDIFVVCSRKKSNKHYIHSLLSLAFSCPLFFWGFSSTCQKRCYSSIPLLLLLFFFFTNDWINVSFYIHTFKKENESSSHHCTKSLKSSETISLHRFRICCFNDQTKNVMV